MRSKFLLFILLILASCNSNTKPPASTATTSVYKAWQFKTIITTLSRNQTVNAAWIGNNQLDFTNKDTLKFSYGSTRNKPTAYPYHITHDTIFIQNKPAYKILKLTANELHLLVAFKKIGKDSTIIVYKAK